MPLPDLTPRLRHLMAAAEIPSFRALARTAQVSDWAITQVRRGQVTHLRVGTAIALAQALGLSLPDLLHHLGETTPAPISRDSQARIHTLEQEYQRLQGQVEHQLEAARQALQAAAIAQLEPWLLQWPTAVHAVTQNPTLPASRLLPLVEPVTNLLHQWQIEPLATIGDQVPYDPQHHQLMAGTAQLGDPVRVRYAGYRQGKRLLYRAKVSPMEP